MAKRSVKEILSMSGDEIMRLNKSQLTALTRQLASTANRKISNLQKSKVARFSLALRNLRGGKKHTGKIRNFSLWGKTGSGKRRAKTRNELLKEFTRASRFLSDKTSSVSGVKSVMRDVTKRIGKFRSKAQQNRFWNAYNELNKDYRDVIIGRKISTNEVQSMLYDRMIGNKKVDIDDLIETMRSEMETRYVKEETTEGEDTPFRVMYEQIKLF